MKKNGNYISILVLSIVTLVLSVSINLTSNSLFSNKHTISIVTKNKIETTTELKRERGNVVNKKKEFNNFVKSSYKIEEKLSTTTEEINMTEIYTEKYISEEELIDGHTEKIENAQFFSVTVEDITTELEEPSDIDGDIEDIPIPISDYDFNLLCQVVECETHGGDLESKTHIVNVIRNRLSRPEWGSTYSSVILEPYQFGRRSDITQDTIDAVNYALSNPDNTYGSIAFHSGGYSNTFFGYGYVFTDAVGHHFYR